MTVKTMIYHDMTNIHHYELWCSPDPRGCWGSIHQFPGSPEVHGRGRGGQRPELLHEVRQEVEGEGGDQSLHQEGGDRLWLRARHHGELRGQSGQNSRGTWGEDISHQVGGRFLTSHLSHNGCIYVIFIVGNFLQNVFIKFPRKPYLCLSLSPPGNFADLYTHRSISQSTEHTFSVRKCWNNLPSF